MKRLIAAAALAAITSLCAAGPAADMAFSQESDRLNAQLDAGKMTPLEFARGQAALAKTLLSDDQRIVQIYEYKVELASQLERGEITREQMLSNLAARADAYYPQQAQPVAQPAPQPNLAGAMALRVFADSFNRSRQPVPRNCQTIALGGTYTTTCQ